MINAAVCAMQMLQKEMVGEWEKAGITNDDNVMDLVKEARMEIEDLPISSQGLSQSSGDS